MASARFKLLTIIMMRMFDADVTMAPDAESDGCESPV